MIRRTEREGVWAADDRKAPIGWAMGGSWRENEVQWREIHFDDVFLGARYELIVIRRNHATLQEKAGREWLDEMVRCRLEPGGIWIEVDW